MTEEERTAWQLRIDHLTTVMKNLDVFIVEDEDGVRFGDVPPDLVAMVRAIARGQQ